MSDHSSEGGVGLLAVLLGGLMVLVLTIGAFMLLSDRRDGPTLNVEAPSAPSAPSTGGN